MKPDLLRSDSESIHYSLDSALGTDQYARPIKMQSCNATQANKMPLKDRKAVGMGPHLPLKAFSCRGEVAFSSIGLWRMHELKSRVQVSEGARLSHCAGRQMITCPLLTKWLPPKVTSKKSRFILGLYW